MGKPNEKQQMPLIEGNLRLQRFAELASQAERIDVAVAWARPCEAKEALAASGADIRIAVGISNNLTDPTTLRSLNTFAELRIVPNKTRGIFHPKYYCFHGEKTIYWIGSANLTRSGFDDNVELIHEFDVHLEDRNWFERLWAGLEPDPMEAILEYEQKYTPPKRTPRPPPGSKPERPSLADIETWDQFVEGLLAYDAYYRYHYHEYGWDVLGETHSLLHTITNGREAVRLNDLRELTQRECYILRGRDSEEGHWALLGSVLMGAESVFNPANMPGVGPVRMQIREQVDQVLSAGPGEIAEVAHNAMEAIRDLRPVENSPKRIGHAAATHWLTLARPDCLVSVNRASARELGKASGLPQDSSKLADRYSDLLNWLYEKPWFNEFSGRQPDDSQVRDIWNCRVALVDAFVYKPSTPAIASPDQD